MKKRFIAVSAVAVALCLALAGCGGSGSGSASASASAASGSASAAASASAASASAGSTAVSGEGLVGTWLFESAAVEGQVQISSDDIKVIRSLGYDCYFQIQDDGTAYLDNFGAMYAGFIDPVGANETEAFLENTADKTDTSIIKLAVNGNELTADNNGVIFTFTRGTDAQITTSGPQAKYLTDGWIVNGTAAVELSGEELYWLCCANDYSWNRSENLFMKKIESDSAIISVIDSEGNGLSIDAMRALKKGGAGSQILYMLTTTQFASPTGAYEDCFGTKPADYAESGDWLVSTVANSAGVQYLVFVSPASDEGGYVVWIAGDEGVSILGGLLDFDLGASVSDAYATLAAVFAAK